MWPNSLLIISVVIISGYCEQNSLFTPQCSRSDEECLTKVAQTEAPRFIAGLPDLGIEPLDPFFLKNYTTDLAGLVFTTSGQAKGYKNVLLDNVAFDFSRKVFTINGNVNMTLKGKYRAAGRLLFLPIEGDGDIKIKAVNVIVNITSPFEIVTDADNKQHVQFKDFDMKFDVVGNVHYTLTNLFNGNRELSDAMHNFLNTNWKLVSNEFAAPVVRTGIDQLFKSMNKLFSVMSLEQLFLN